MSRPEYKEIPDLNLGAFLITKGFPQVVPPRLSANGHHLIRTFQRTRELDAEIDLYYIHEARVDPTRFIENVKSSKAMASELRKIVPLNEEGGDLDA